MIAPSRRSITLGIMLVVIALAAADAFLAAQRFLPAIRAPFLPAPADITETIPRTGEESATTTPPDFPLHLPPGFTISIFAKDLPGARVMALDQFRNIWVSQTSEGIISLLEIADGRVRSQSTVFRNLRKPHGLAFDPVRPGLLYIAEEHRVIRRMMTPSDDPGEDVLALPSGEGHFTRTIAFGPDGGLYISIGSSCNVCNETDERRATILRYDPETGRSEPFARGLRNAVFFAWDAAGRMWATEMGRDWLGDDTPPDEINRIGGPSTGSGQSSTPNFGWPNCYGKNIHDTDFDKNTYVRNPCMEPFERGSFLDIPAHSAPLGLAFIPEIWPAEYRGDLLVAYHGSWNRSTPTGYKVVRYKIGDQGTVSSEQDLLTGFLVPSSVEGLAADGALGRPVDLLFQTDGSLLLSDDKAGAIYRIAPPKS